MSAPKRLQVKLFFQQPEDLVIKAFVPAFHRWIQEQSLEDLLIDVHNYSHMHHGPGILLVAHEGDYSIDLAGGRTGLIYRRKREAPDNLPDLLRLSLRRVVLGALLVEHDPAIPGSPRFRTDEVEILLVDRLAFPNEEKSFEAVKGEIAQVLEEVFGSGNARVERVANDVREPLTLRVAVPEPPSLEALGTALQIERQLNPL